MTNSPKLVRMTPAPLTTEYNDQWGLYTAHDDGKFYLHPDSVPAAIKVGFRPAPLSQSDRLGRVMDAIADLDDGADKAALNAAFGAQQLLVWRARQARQATSTPA